MDLSTLDPVWLVLVLVAAALGLSPRALGPAVLRQWAASLDERGGGPMGAVVESKLDAKLEPILAWQAGAAARHAEHAALLEDLRREVAYLRGHADATTPGAPPPLTSIALDRDRMTGG